LYGVKLFSQVHLWGVEASSLSGSNAYKIRNTAVCILAFPRIQHPPRGDGGGPTKERKIFILALWVPPTKLPVRHTNPAITHLGR